MDSSKTAWKAIVVADDFTGACDTGVQMRKQGHSVEVILSSEGASGEVSIVLDTESRNISETDAETRVREMVAGCFARQSYDIIYKKVDSTLRGNVAAELRALQEVVRADRVFFAPAFPAIGRTTTDGILYLQGIRLMETEFAKDPLKPIQTDSIVEIVQTLGDVHHYSVAELRDPHFSVGEGQWFSFDVASDEDLERIVDAGMETGESVLWVGSAGLANALFRRLGQTRPSIAVIGSISATSIAQVDFAEEQGALVLQPTIRDMLYENNTGVFAQEMLYHLRQGEDVILASTRSREQYEATMAAAEKYGIDGNLVGAKIQAYLAEVLYRVLEEFEPSGIFLTGGETAYGLIRRLSASGCRIEEEVLTGIVRSRLSGGIRPGLPIITKAGAFGNQDALYTCLNLLKERGK